MTVPYWKTAEPADSVPGESAKEVNEQHPLPTGTYWSSDGVEYEDTNPQHPFPVEIMAQPGPRFIFKQVTVQGMIPAVAYTAGEQFGGVTQVTGVPSTGVIQEIKYHDIDNEGITKEIWVFSGPPILAADNAAFLISDTDILNVIGVFDIGSFRLGGSANQVGFTVNTPCAYAITGNTLYLALKTNGADNIAVNALPVISMVIGVGS